MNICYLKKKNLLEIKTANCNVHETANAVVHSCDILTKLNSPPRPSGALHKLHFIVNSTCTALYISLLLHCTVNILDFSVHSQCT